MKKIKLHFIIISLPLIIFFSCTITDQVKNERSAKKCYNNEAKKVYGRIFKKPILIINTNEKYYELMIINFSKYKNCDLRLYPFYSLGRILKTNNNNMFILKDTLTEQEIKLKIENKKVFWNKTAGYFNIKRLICNSISDENFKIKMDSLKKCFSDNFIIRKGKLKCIHICGGEYYAIGRSLYLYSTKYYSFALFQHSIKTLPIILSEGVWEISDTLLTLKEASTNQTYKLNISDQNTIYWKGLPGVVGNKAFMKKE